MAGTRNIYVAVSHNNQDITDVNELRFGDDDLSNYVALKAPASVGSNLTLTLPSADGIDGQVLKTNGSGVLSFTTVSAEASISPFLLMGG